LLPTLGGQVGLNLAVELHESGVLRECGVELLGTKLESIKQAEDRELFRDLMNELGEPVPESDIIHNLEEARRFVEKILSSYKLKKSSHSLFLHIRLFLFYFKTKPMLLLFF